MTPDIQYFAESGTWTKPAGAVRVDYLICAGGGAGSILGGDGEDGELQSGSFDADALPDKVQVDVGRGGRGAKFGHVKAGDGADGYALLITHLERQDQGSP